MVEVADKPIDTLQKRIEERLAHLGVSAWTASKEATGSPDAIRQIFKGHSPSAERLDAIAERLGTTAAWLLGRDDAKSITQNFSDATQLFRQEQPNGPPLPIYSSTLGADLSIGIGGPESVEVTNIDMNEVVGHVGRPRGLAPQVKAYGVYVVGASMEPRFDPGQRVFVDINRPPRNGDDVIVQLRDEAGAIVAGLLKRLVRQTSAEIVLRQFNPPGDFAIARDRVALVQRVFTSDELIGD